MKDKLSWRLPTKDELNLMYENLYKKDIGGFADDYYWSASECNSIAWGQHFSKGYQYDFNKYFNGRIRAVCTFHSKAGGDLYEIGQETETGFVFNIRYNTLLICKKEDESELMNWYEAMEKFGGKK